MQSDQNAIVQDKNIPGSREEDILNAHDILQLMLIEYGDVHIKTLGQLLQLTRSAEQHYTRICILRVCR